jgi:hypothetical protein
LSFIKENHGGSFRKVAFSGMLEPLVKLRTQAHLHKKRFKELNIKIKEQEEVLKKLQGTMVMSNSAASCLDLNTPASEQMKFYSTLEQKDESKKSQRNASLSRKVMFENFLKFLYRLKYF